MNLLSSLQFTINEIFELYKTQGKRWYNFSMVFTILSLLFSTVFVAIVVFLYHLAVSTMDGMSFDLEKIVTRTTFLSDLQIYSQFMVTLTIALFGIVVFAHSKKDDAKITFGNFFGSIPSGTWALYFVLITAGILVSKYIDNLLTPNMMNRNSFTYMMERSDYSSPFVEWLISIVRLPLVFLQVILAWFLVRRYFAGQGVVFDKRADRTSFLTLIITGFCIHVLSTEIVFFVQSYVLKLLSLPFQEPLIPAILGIVLYVLLIAIFYPALAGAAIFPFLYRDGREKNIRRQVTNEEIIDEL